MPKYAVRVIDAQTKATVERFSAEIPPVAGDRRTVRGRDYVIAETTEEGPEGGQTRVLCTAKRL